MTTPVLKLVRAAAEDAFEEAGDAVAFTALLGGSVPDADSVVDEAAAWIITLVANLDVRTGWADVAISVALGTVVDSLVDSDGVAEELEILAVDSVDGEVIIVDVDVSVVLMVVSVIDGN